MQMFFILQDRLVEAAGMIAWSLIFLAFIESVTRVYVIDWIMTGSPLSGELEKILGN